MLRKKKAKKEIFSYKAEVVGGGYGFGNYYDHSVIVTVSSNIRSPFVFSIFYAAKVGMDSTNTIDVGRKNWRNEPSQKVLLALAKRCHLAYLARYKKETWDNAYTGQFTAKSGKNGPFEVESKFYANCKDGKSLSITVPIIAEKKFKVL